MSEADAASSPQASRRRRTSRSPSGGVSPASGKSELRSLSNGGPSSLSLSPGPARKGDGKGSPSQSQRRKSRSPQRSSGVSASSSSSQSSLASSGSRASGGAKSGSRRSSSEKNDGIQPKQSSQTDLSRYPAGSESGTPRPTGARRPEPAQPKPNGAAAEGPTRSGGSAGAAKPLARRRKTSTRQSFRVSAEQAASPAAAISLVADAPGIADSARSNAAHKKDAASEWLHAWRDSVADTRAYAQHIALADVRRDGDTQLVVADLKKKLKLFRGTSLVNEMVLMARPVALQVLYMDDNRQRLVMVSIAVGIDDAVFIYRNLRPYRVFRLPLRRISEGETEVWAEFRKGSMPIPAAQEKMHVLRRKGEQLSDAALALMSPEAGHNRSLIEALARQCMDGAPTSVSAMAVLPRVQRTIEPTGVLAIGTEDARLLILDAAAKKVSQSIDLPDVAQFIACTGSLESEHTVAVGCREGQVVLVTQGKIRKVIANLEAPTVGFVATENHAIAAGMDCTLRAFGLHPTVSNYSVSFPAPVHCLESMRHSATTQVFTLVALANHEVRVYRGAVLVSVLPVEEEVSAMRFGLYARAENSLVLLYRSGAIGCKILSRRARLEAATTAQPTEEKTPLDLPKKGKLYLQQVHRERTQAPNVHRVFNTELLRMRLNIMRAYAQVLGQNIGNQNFGSGSSVRLGVRVLGLGPAFIVRIEIENTGLAVLERVPVTFMYHRDVYTIRPAYFTLPCLVPGEVYQYAAHIRCIEESGGSDDVQIVVLSPSPAESEPLVTYTLKMPLSNMAEDY
jgi:Bardet-Biedl syndrome 1 protein